MPALFFSSRADAVLNNDPNGPIVPHAKVRLIFFGPEWSDTLDHRQRRDRLVADATEVFNRPEFYVPLWEYWGRNGRPVSGTLDSVDFYSQEPQGVCHYTNPVVGQRPCVSQAQAIARVRALEGLNPDPGAIYVVISPPGFGAVDAGAGEHDEFQAPKRWVPYARAEANIATLAHEVMEMMVNPLPNHDRAWTDPATDPALAEIIDKCVGASGVGKWQYFNGVDLQEVYSLGLGGCVGWVNWPELPGKLVASTDTWPTPTPLGVQSPAVWAPNASFVVAPRANASGQPTIFGITPQNEVHYLDYTNGWTSWVTPPSAGWVSRIAAVSSSRGNDLLGIGGDGRIWSKLTEIPGEVFHRTSDFLASDILAVEGDAIDPVHLLALLQDGTVATQPLTQYSYSIPSAWTSLPGLPGPATHLAAVNILGLPTVVAAVGSSLYRADYFEMITGQFHLRHWGAWQAIGTMPAAVRQIVLGHTAAASPGGERVAAFVLLENGSVMQSYDGLGGAIATGWSASWLPSMTRQIAVANNYDGKLELFGIDLYNRVQHARQSSLADHDWAQLASLGGSVSTLQVFTWPSGQLELYGVQAGTNPTFQPDMGEIAHIWQDFRNGEMVWSY